MDIEAQKRRIEAQIRFSRWGLLIALLTATPGLLEEEYAVWLLARGYTWPLELLSAPGGGAANWVAAATACGGMFLRGVRVRSFCAFAAGAWGLALATHALSPFSFAFAYLGGLGFSGWIANTWERPVSFAINVAAPALSMLVLVRGVALSPWVVGLVQEHQRVAEARKYAVHRPRPRVQCDDTLNWLCSRVRRMAAAPDGHIVIVQENGTIGVWAADRRKEWVADLPDAFVEADWSELAYSPDGLTVTYSTGAELLLVSAHGEVIREVLAPCAESLSTAPVRFIYSSRGSLLRVIGSAYCEYETFGGHRIVLRPSVCDGANAMAVSTAEDRIVAACGERLVERELDSGAERSVALPEDVELGALAFRPVDGALVGIAKGGQGVWVWSDPPQEPVRMRRPSTLDPDRTALFVQGQYFAYGHGLKVWIDDSQSGRHTWSIQSAKDFDQVITVNQGRGVAVARSWLGNRRPPQASVQVPDVPDLP